MWMKSIVSTVMALAVCLAAAACSGPQTDASVASGRGGVLPPTERDVATWGPGPDNGRY